ncbi:thioredoxin domain-containing protein 15-like isoform X2 [Pollicipes pollicipes]|uniref:thioredoxin domain-containing protein 15-like isoform X2 n=1 Tax=Pollicipes pollicipes TaxID=41117 RepID=UPI001884EEBC|nr:thioredoxin domain-containing protein 15-like isoform X2 [Pollicipes pollicipes]
MHCPPIIHLLAFVLLVTGSAQDSWEETETPAKHMEADEESVPAFHDAISGENNTPEPPTLRQILERMQRDSSLTDEYTPESVWLHSKAGDDMAEPAGPGGDAPDSSVGSSAEEDEVGPDRRRNATAILGVDVGESVSDNSTTNSTSKVCNCMPLNRTQEELTVQMVSAATLSDELVQDTSVRSRSTPARCLLVLFYGSTCPFSAAAAPHVNAMPRAFPDLPVMAVDALENGSLNTRFGIIAVPTVILFHNGRPQARFNQSEPTLQLLADFVRAQTQLSAAVLLNVTSADFGGPLPSVPEQRLDWYLVAAWLFIVVCALYGGTRLRLWRRAADTVRNWWIEAEQHLHEE